LAFLGLLCPDEGGREIPPLRNPTRHRAARKNKVGLLRSE
jgi:hypothetical protein